MKSRDTLAGARVIFLHLLVACGGERTTQGKWEGTPADASIDVFDLGSAYPTADPDPSGGTMDKPDFGDGGVTGPFTCTGKSGGKGDDALALVSNGLPRTALLHVPSSYDPTAGAMLVLNFHGYTSDALQELVLTRMNASSDKHGYVVVYPQGVSRSWNAGACCGTAWTNRVDDIQFTKDLLARLAKDWCIDPKRIHATGFSNGGFFSHRIGCEMADVFASIAPVSGVMGMDPSQCNPLRPIPVLDVHGTADPIVPYNGGTPILPVDFGGAPPFRSVSDTLSIWRQKNKCLGQGQSIYSKGDATCTAYGTCSANVEVVHCKIDGGGHAWPGGVPIPFVGKTSQDISATETMVSFFNAHPHP